MLPFSPWRSRRSGFWELHEGDRPPQNPKTPHLILAGINNSNKMNLEVNRHKPEEVSSFLTTQQ
jgi:hypothetical protein